MLKSRWTALAAAAVSGLMIGSSAMAQSPVHGSEPITEAAPLPGPDGGTQLAPEPASAPEPTYPGMSSGNPVGSMPTANPPHSHNGTVYGGTVYQGRSATMGSVPSEYGSAGYPVDGGYPVDSGYYGGYPAEYGYGGEVYGGDVNSWGARPRIPRDYAWQRPVRRPIWRTPVVYNRYWPDYYYGVNGAPQGYARALPPVYQPTDTTQQGYYYQQVPMWQPNPAMLPPAPWPWDWHHLVPATAYNARGEWDDNDYVRARYGAGQSYSGVPVQQANGGYYQP